MTAHILALVLANALMLLVGAGILPLLSLARTRSELVARLPLAYAVGLAATGIVSAHLALLHVPIGRIGLPVLALVMPAIGLYRLPRGTWRLRPPEPAAFAVAGVLALTAAFLVQAARLFAVKPLLENDGWAIWAARARALYDFGHPVAPVFTDPIYPALQYPLLLPSLEAIDFRFMGTFDGTVIHLQLLGLALAFVGAAWNLLRDHTRPLLLAAGLLAIVTAPTFLSQLQTNYADVPLAMYMALGVCSLAAWLARPAPGLLPAAALFLGAAALTKNEGEMFALAAYLAAFAAAGRGARRPLLPAALASLAIELPWRLWVQVHHLQTRDYALSNLFRPTYLWRHRDRVAPSAHELWTQISSLHSWSLLLAFSLFGLVAAPALRSFRRASFALLWLVLSFGGLILIYWISRNALDDHLFNTADRTINSIVIGAALLVPVLVGRARTA